MDDLATNVAAADIEVELVDLTDVDLGDLRALDDTPFAHALRRIIEESRDQHDDVVAGFESSIQRVPETDSR